MFLGSPVGHLHNNRGIFTRIRAPSTQVAGLQKYAQTAYSPIAYQFSTLSDTPVLGR